MSVIKINRDTLNKLTHESIEIRLRTMEQLSSKLNRALALNENIEFKPGDLCKQLIRWFGFMPVQEPEKVLNLLKSILESSKYGSKAIEKLGAERIVKELRKIQSLYDRHSVEYKIVSKMKEFLKHHITPSKKNEIEKDSEDMEELIQCANNMQIAEKEYNSADYEISWTRPSSSDYTSMKFLSDILINKFASTMEIENAIQHLQLTMDDYPPEYFLQAPHIFRNLLQIYDYRKNTEKLDVSLEMVTSTLMQFLMVLEKRLKIQKTCVAFQKNKVEKGSQTPFALKFEKALYELFDASVFHLESNSCYGTVTPIVWDLIFKLLHIIEQVDRKVEISFLYKIASVISNLSVKFAETEYCARLRLHQMILIFLLQDIAQVNTRDNLLKTVEVFEPILRDYTMKCFFKARYKLLEDHVLKVDKSLNEKYQLLKSYEVSFEMAVQMLTNSSKWSCNDIIKEGHSVCAVLDMLQSKRLIDVLFAATIHAIPLYKGKEKLKDNAIQILLRILNLTYMPLKVYAYEKLSAAFKKHIGCLMTGERYIMECSNVELLECHIIGVPLNSELLQQIVHDSYENSCDKIQKNCYKILELLLQSQTLFGTSWWSLLPILLPLLPLLNCCTLSDKLMNLLLKLYDPDLKHLPYVNVLQGNLGFLFHENAERRSEALTRLIYTLNSLEKSEKYVPNLLEISDTLPNDVCLQSTPREYRNIFSDRLPVRPDVVNSLYNLLHLLDSPDVEPLIRKTTLMQINVLCNNWQVTGELCNLAAYYLILQALENALLQSSSLDYPDAAVPAISILNKLMLYDSSFRCELADTPNIYVLLLRALMMFHHDIQVRQDATMCLFQLLFSTKLIATENSMEGPLILGNIQMPLDINLRSILSNKIHQEPEKLSAIFASALEESQYWRMVVASTYFDGLQNITQKSISLLSQLDITDNLKLTSQDIRLIRATQPCVALQRLLKAASNATEHRSLIQACILLKQQLLIPNLANTYSVSDEFCQQLNDILKKYLQMPPGNNADLELYEHLLDVTKICITIPLVPVVLEIFNILIKDSRHALITLLSQHEEIPLRIFNKIAILLKYLISEHNDLFENHYNSSECSTFYSNLFDLFVERCLQLFEIRDLQRVRCFLSLLVVISSCQLEMPDQLIFFYCRRFAQLSLALKSFTQTGAQWHRSCLLSILHLSDQMQNPRENFRLTAGFVKYLSGLCGHNDVEVRTLSWSILNITAKTVAITNPESERKSSDISGRELLVNELSYLPGGFIACCLSTLLDVEEAIAVRHLAGQLMVVLIQNHEQVEEMEKLVEKYNFVRLATESLTSCLCVLEKEIPKNLDTSSIDLTTCDLISCYTLICIEISIRTPAFLDELCTRSFMFKLYEIIKQSPPRSLHSGYLNMIGHICRLYSMCYSNNFPFLQRTICRDPVWLNSFCQILFEIVSLSDEEYIINNMLQFLLILCKDTTALEQLLIKLQNYSNDIVKLFQNALAIKNLNTGLQSYTLSILSFLFIKSQSAQDKDLSVNIHDLFEKKNVFIESTVFKDKFESDNKENNTNLENRKNGGTRNIRKRCINKKQKDSCVNEKHLDDENGKCFEIDMVYLRV